MMVAIRTVVGVILGVCIGGCFAVYLFFSLKKYCRKEKNIEQFLGVALARIHNVDAETED
jgi:uncharacterized membrane protein YgaE (UPF0421/DUF939 family)